ncbi:MAG: hypothetical protein NC548_40270 [Lachnospiraceae bacterium]|nr:hypothetical protein [Lachnospiraceae bacterium]
MNIAAMATVCFATTSCSSGEDPILNGGNDETTGTEIILAFNDGGDTQTRSARPVYSSEANNNVNEVKLALFVKSGDNWIEASEVKFISNDVELTNGLLGWEPATEAGVKGDNKAGRDVTKQLTLKGLAKNSIYHIVAYGYDNENTETDISANGQIFTATPIEGKDVEEIFAGTTEFTTDANGKISKATKVTMKRQVAGFLGYFKNIPTTVEGTTVKGVRVIASASAPSYTFGGGGCTEDQNQTGTKAGNVTIFDREIPTTATEKDGHYEFQQETKGVYVAPNSLLSGKFLIAFAAQTDTPTFVVQLYDAAGKTLRHWNVKNGNTNTYNVNRNQFYMIGKKYTNNGGKDPEDPEPDPKNPDEPIDLSENSEIELILNDAWDVIYNLTLE